MSFLKISTKYKSAHQFFKEHYFYRKGNFFNLGNMKKKKKIWNLYVGMVGKDEIESTQKMSLKVDPKPYPSPTPKKIVNPKPDTLQPKIDPHPK